MKNWPGFIVLLVFVSGSMLAQPRSEKFPTDNYFEYETEDVSDFRKAYAFTYPEVVLDTVVEVINTYEEVSPYFEGGTTFYLDGAVSVLDMIQRHIWINSQTTKVSGYRVQIYAGVRRDGAFSAKASFNQSHSGASSYLTHISPTYRVRVGDFTDKEEADLFCRRLRDEGYRSAFVVRDEVKVQKYLPRPEGEVEDIEEVVRD